MMNVEKLFRRIPSFNKLNMDIILFESKYPVLFTCTNGQEVYLFSCCLMNASVIKWIGTKTDYEILVKLLENKITIQEAFLNGEDEKFWGLVGLLHDVDYEKYPDEHCKKAPELLKEIDASEDMVHAICSHAYGSCSDVEPVKEMEKILYAVDELTGLI